MDAAPTRWSADLDTPPDGIAVDCDLCAGDDATGDLDGDGSCDDQDPDDDGDGCLDALDALPEVWAGDSETPPDGVSDHCDLCAGADGSMDTDGDGTCDDRDDDDDDDGCVDALDAHPTEASGDSDAPPDGVPDDCDLCHGDDGSGDADQDGQCGDVDLDDDGDGCLDPEDAAPLVASSDGELPPDGVPDDCDLCEGDDATGDLDGDGRCDDLDGDDDGDGCSDDVDLNPARWSGDRDDPPDGVAADCDLCAGDDSAGDMDGDGVCDDVDLDRDGDGCVDEVDLDPTTWSTDGESPPDGVPDDCDLCDGDDARGDVDGDGLCGDVDGDDDDDGCADGDDARPESPSEDSEQPPDGHPDDCDLCQGDDGTGDTDGDGICDDLDGDDDGDGCLDGDDSQPVSASVDTEVPTDGVPDDCDRCQGSDALGDADGDGLCADVDPDDDGDGCPDGTDRNPDAWSPDLDDPPDGVAFDCDLCVGLDGAGDLDGDGICDDLDADDDGDGCLDAEDAAPGVPSTDTEPLADGVADDCDLCDGDDRLGDLDGDGDCQDVDLDDDDDGCLDVDDLRPLTPSGDTEPLPDGVPDDCDLCLGDDATGDADGDGLCSDMAGDQDDDGCADGVDAAPAIPSVDTEVPGDGVPDDCDLCGGDDVTGDVDGDGVCSDLDGDDDNDGCADAEDLRPLVWSADEDTPPDGIAADCDLCVGDDAGGDTDGDGTCDDVDPDDDDDGCLDAIDLQPGIATADTEVPSDAVSDDCDQCAGLDSAGDVDGDGVCSDLDGDDDDDGCADAVDRHPAEASTDTERVPDGVSDDCDQCAGDDATGDGDGDGVCNDLDDDDDDDGCPDVVDSRPGTASADSEVPPDGVPDDCDLCDGADASGDSDGDGSCDDLDDDDDDDGCPDTVDAFPVAWSPDLDAPPDGVARDCDSCRGHDETGDSDGDGTCDDVDLDDDDDLCPDLVDLAPLVPSVDSELPPDGVPDDCDLCDGNDAAGDGDGDGVCDDVDADDDDDGCVDVLDARPRSASSDGEVPPDGVPDDCDVCRGDDGAGDLDGDSVCDDLDPDDDGDGCLDGDDSAPAVPSLDTEAPGDGIPDDCDLCLGEDASGDPDGDGSCSDVDSDDDDDGCLDGVDARPVSFAADTESPPDGVADDCDACFGDDAVGDTDGDGLCDDVDDDDDGDGCFDAVDAAPLVASGDSDDPQDGVSDDCDLCEGVDSWGDADGDGICDLPLEFYASGELGPNPSAFTPLLIEPCTFGDLNQDGVYDLLCSATHVSPLAVYGPTFDETAVRAFSGPSATLGCSPVVLSGGRFVVGWDGTAGNGDVVVSCIGGACGSTNVASMFHDDFDAAIASAYSPSSTEGMQIAGSFTACDFDDDGEEEMIAVTHRMAIPWDSQSIRLYDDDFSEWDTLWTDELEAALGLDPMGLDGQVAACGQVMIPAGDGSESLEWRIFLQTRSALLSLDPNAPGGTSVEVLQEAAMGWDTDVSLVDDVLLVPNGAKPLIADAVAGDSLYNTGWSGSKLAGYTGNQRVRRLMHADLDGVPGEEYVVPFDSGARVWDTTFDTFMGHFETAGVALVAALMVDISGDGTPELLLGDNEGTVRAYSIEHARDGDPSTPPLRWEWQATEPSLYLPGDYGTMTLASFPVPDPDDASRTCIAVGFVLGLRNEPTRYRMARAPLTCTDDPSTLLFAPIAGGDNARRGGLVSLP